MNIQNEYYIEFCCSFLLTWQNKPGLVCKDLQFNALTMNECYIL